MIRVPFFLLLGFNKGALLRNLVVIVLNSFQVRG